MATNATALERLARLNEKLKRAPEGRTLYYAGDEVVEFSHDGVPYDIPPDGSSKRMLNDRPGISVPGIIADFDEFRKYDGTLVVFARYGVDDKTARDHRKKLRDGMRNGRPVQTPPANKLLASADDIVRHAIIKVGACGVTILTGDSIEDAKAKAEARKQWLLFKKGQCERVIKNYQDRTQAFHANPNNKGQLAPEMTDYETSCQEWLDDYRNSQKAVRRFPCPANCGYRTDSEARLKTHVDAAHPLFADDPEDDEPEKKAAKGKR